ncbi:class I SAM-dependent methyltransferase [Fluviicola taffensis]|uniref:Methyltransferase type 11 n=1 Tax=Fluviicola taffensis (strain DSM 16823 / NCIMB 13979 / RW262) TaxID=755732 RepID=F2IBT9_FLUTR|nr:class I SAM-dependent methyltransferase [Fluviicola taffensis]AEA42167.1 Methyltransferase type 11 [Fluviicola taffensis DSM 16823]
MEKEELAALASQLSHPSGDKGIEIAQMMNETNIGMTKNAISNLNLTADDSVLELGHGNGGHLEFLLSQNTNINYTGLEISTLMNQEAQLRNQQFIDLKKAFFELYDGKIIPFSENQFDKLFTVNTLYFWDKPLEIFAELSRILKPNGLLSLTFAHRSFMETLPFTPFGFTLYNPDEVMKLIEQSNFRLIHEDLQLETVMTKAGDPVERKFSTFVLDNNK